MQRLATALFAAALILAPFSARSADLVVWWDKGLYEQEDQPIRDMVAAFERQSGESVELVLVPQGPQFTAKLEAALGAGSPPDLARGGPCCLRADRWAANGVLVDLSDVVLPIRHRFFPGLLQYTFLPDPKSGAPAPFTAPLGQFGHYIHVWTSLLSQAGFTLDDIPEAWAPFWSFWCDQVQPALRQALGRDDVWGVGLAMSPGGDTVDAIEQFMIANSAYLWTGTRSSLDDPTFRSNLVKSIDSYTAIWRKGCTPPDASTWQYPDNNRAFLEQRVVMTINTTLSIPGALRVSRPADYYQNTATIDWPKGPDDRIFPSLIGFLEAVVFAQGRNVAGAKRFLRFLLNEDWLGASLEAAGGRYMPLIVEDLGKPFWTDLADPHRLPAVEQLAAPTIPDWGPIRRWLPEWDTVQPRQLMAEAVYSVVTEGITPEQAVDEAIARIKRILSE